jgi:hypothetical protein
MTNSHNNTLAPAAPPEGALWSFWEFLGVIDCGDPSGNAFSPELREAIARARSWDEQSEREALLRKRREAMTAVRAMVKAREKIGQGPVSYADIRSDVLALNARYEQPIDHFSLSPRFRQVVWKAKEALRNKTVRVFEFEDVDGVTELCEVFLQFSEHTLLEAGAMQMSGGAFGFLRALDRLYGHLFIPVEDARVFLPANSPETPELIIVPPEPPASVTIPSATETGRRGGKKSGEVRRESRPWVPHAEKLALAVDPNLSNEAIATEISGGWKRPDVDPPGIRTLMRFVAKLRSGAILPPRKPQPKASKDK